MTPELKELLNNLGKSSYGAALQEYLNLKYEELNDVLKATEQDLRGRQFAIKIMNELFGFLGDNSKVAGRNKKQYT